MTRIGYRIEGGKSALQVYRNYQDTLRAGGFKTVFECKGDEQCGGDFQSFVFNSGKVRRLGEGDAVFGGKYYVALAKKEAPSGDVYAFLDVMQDESNKRTPVFLMVVEAKAMQTGQVSLPDATAMQKALTESGKVAVYGVYFDTDRADVKAESKAALDEMGKLLQADPALKVYIVGHTDNQAAWPAIWICRKSVRMRWPRHWPSPIVSPPAGCPPRAWHRWRPWRPTMSKRGAPRTGASNWSSSKTAPESKKANPEGLAFS